MLQNMKRIIIAAVVLVAAIGVMVTVAFMVNAKNTADTELLMKEWVDIFAVSEPVKKQIVNSRPDKIGTPYNQRRTVYKTVLSYTVNGEKYQIRKNFNSRSAAQNYLDAEHTIKYARSNPDIARVLN
jgi:predicted small secreted protein